MTSSLQIMIEKNLELDQQRQPNNFILKPSLKSYLGGRLFSPGVKYGEEIACVK